MNTVTIPTKLYSEYAEHLLHILLNSKFPRKEAFTRSMPDLHRAELNFANLNSLNIYATLERASDGELTFVSEQWGFMHNFVSGKNTVEMQSDLGNLVRTAATKWTDMDVIKNKVEKNKVYDKNGALLKDSTAPIDILQFIHFTNNKEVALENYRRHSAREFKKAQANTREKSALDAAVEWFKENNTCLKELFAVVDWLKDYKKVDFYGPNVYDKVVGMPRNVIEETQYKLLESKKKEICDSYNATAADLDNKFDKEFAKLKEKYQNLMLDLEKKKQKELEEVERTFKVM